MASTPTRGRIDPRMLGRCPSGKVGYLTSDAAATAADQMMRRDRVDPGCHVTPYRCGQCADWHVWNRVIVPYGWTGAR